MYIAYMVSIYLRELGLVPEIKRRSLNQEGRSVRSHRAATSYPMMECSMPCAQSHEVGTASDDCSGKVGELLAPRVLHSYIGGSEPERRAETKR
jgi:hypothetical protein